MGADSKEPLYPEAVYPDEVRGLQLAATLRAACGWTGGYSTVYEDGDLRPKLWRTQFR